MLYNLTIWNIYTRR